MKKPAFNLLLALLTSVLSSTAFGDQRLGEAALARTNEKVVYDGSYRTIPFPGGDVPSHTGVCTDVVIRSYRAIGIDLQELVHADMTANFSAYPTHWGLTKPDTNIDHRRVPNLETFLSRNGNSLPVSRDPRNFLPGDVVSWRLANGLPHIGIVSPRKHPVSQRPLIVHNIGRGPQEEDVLFNYTMTGHYRYSNER